MCKPNEEMVSEETFREWLRTIFSLCYEGDLEELFGEEAGDEDLIDYVVDYYAAGLYPKIFEHFEYNTGCRRISLLKPEDNRLEEW